MGGKFISLIISSPPLLSRARLCVAKALVLRFRFELCFLAEISTCTFHGNLSLFSVSLVQQVVHCTAVESIFRTYSCEKNSQTGVNNRCLKIALPASKHPKTFVCAGGVGPFQQPATGGCLPLFLVFMFTSHDERLSKPIRGEIFWVFPTQRKWVHTHVLCARFRRRLPLIMRPFYPTFPTWMRTVSVEWIQYTSYIYRKTVVPQST